MGYPEVMADADVGPADVEHFLKRLNKDSLHLESFSIDKHFKDEEGLTERFQATLRFKGGHLAPEYPAPSCLRLSLLWVLDKSRWSVERPFGLEHWVVSNANYPTVRQEEIAIRCHAVADVHKKIGFSGSNNLIKELAPLLGNSTNDYEELARLYPLERGAGGVPPNAKGVGVFLRAASSSECGWHTLYQDEFSVGLVRISVWLFRETCFGIMWKRQQEGAGSLKSKHSSSQRKQCTGQ